MRKYEPGLDNTYSVDGNNYTNITYLIVILYCELPVGIENPKEQRVIAVMTNCIPNGKLYNIYKDKVFSAGKTSELCIKKGQQINLGSGKTLTTTGNETLKKIEKDHSLTYEKYCQLNGLKKIQWEIDARFNYKDIKFATLENERRSRVKKIYLKNDLYQKFFYYVSQNEERKKPIDRQKDSIENFEFIEDLKFF